MFRRFVSIVSGLTVLAPNITSAHIFGQQVALPLPVDFYVTGGVMAFIASCAILLFFSEPESASEQTHEKLPGLRVPKMLAWSLSMIGVLVLFFSIALAYFGSQDFVTNPLPNLFWIGLFLVFTYITGFLIGGLWKYLDPFRSIAEIICIDIEERPAPRWLSYVPIAVFISLTWLELYSDALGAIPVVVGTAIVFIAALDNVGSTFYGVKTWFTKASFFSVFFDLVSRVAPLQIIDYKIYLMWPGQRLIREEAQHISILLFTMTLLGATLLDGLRETKLWYELTQSIPFAWDNFLGIVFLSVAPLILYTLYAACIFSMKALTNSPLSFSKLQLRFAFSLVPIVLAYHFAHYFTIVLSQGQALIAQLSDPFNKKWDIFSTAGYQINYEFIRADSIWYIQLSAIVLGHVLAAVIAHFAAQRTFSTRREVLISQLPMLLLMVGLTAFGLWTLSQPFVQR